MAAPSQIIELSRKSLIERLELDGPQTAVGPRIVDLIAPLGKGQRALISGPARSGKTTLVKELALAIAANNPDVTLFILMVDERPEEIGDMVRSVDAEVV